MGAESPRFRFKAASLQRLLDEAMKRKEPFAPFGPDPEDPRVSLRRKAANATQDQQKWGSGNVGKFIPYPAEQASIGIADKSEGQVELACINPFYSRNSGADAGYGFPRILIKVNGNEQSVHTFLR
jgi:hypothetical protein